MSSIKLKGSSSGEAIITTASDGSSVILDKKLDLQGNEIILDADNDTTITADSDDQIDIKVGGSDLAKLTDGQLTLTSATASRPGIVLESTNADANPPFLRFQKNGSSPADNDEVGLIAFYADDDGGNVFIPAQIKVTTPDVSDGSENGDISFFTSVNGTSAERLVIDDEGFVGIGVTTVQGHLHVDSESTTSTFGRACLAVTTADPTVDSSNQLIVCAFTGDNDCNNGTFISFRDSGGEIGHITCNGSSSVAYNTSSDYRLKENVSYTFDATTRLKQLKPCRFNFKADTDTTVDGFLAHEVSSIIPEAISGTKDETKECVNVVKDSDGTMIHENVTEAEWTQGKTDGTYANDTTWSATATVPQYQGIDQSKLVPLLVKTIQEQQAVIEDLQSRVTTLEG